MVRIREWRGTHRASHRQRECVDAGRDAEAGVGGKQGRVGDATDVLLRHVTAIARDFSLYFFLYHSFMYRTSRIASLVYVSHELREVYFHYSPDKSAMSAYFSGIEATDAKPASFSTNDAGVSSEVEPMMTSRCNF